MSLNYSLWPVSPAHISEDNRVSPLRILNGYLVEGDPEKNGEVYSIPWHVSQVEADERVFSCGRDRVDSCSSLEPTSKDISDLLPSDLFDMDMRSTFTAITEWLEDSEIDCGGDMRSNIEMDCQEGYGFFAGYNVIWNNFFEFQFFPCTIHLNERLNTGLQSFPSNLEVTEKSNASIEYFSNRLPFYQRLNAAHTLCTYEDETSVGSGLAPKKVGFQLAYDWGDVDFSNGSGICSVNTLSAGEVKGSSELERLPCEVLAHILSYLGLKDLLSAERVCRFLSSAVRADPFLWKTIHFDHPLNRRITDDVLVQLTGRAQGNLECLSLVECSKITGDGIRRVLKMNQQLPKLYVPGCTRLGMQFIMDCIRTFNSNNKFGGLKCVRIAGIYGMNRERFQELKSLLGYGSKKLERHRKPLFYRPGNTYLSLDDDCAIDIEMCPRCDDATLLYDCPSEGCYDKDKSTQTCRACSLCVRRCAVCGRCINGNEFEETFYLEFQCLKCCMEDEQYQEMLELEAKTLSAGGSLNGGVSTTCSFVPKHDNIVFLDFWRRG